MKNLDLGKATELEVTALRQLLDHAVKDGGLGVAEAVVHWNRKLNAATEISE